MAKCSILIRDEMTFRSFLWVQEANSIARQEQEHFLQQPIFIRLPA